MTEPLFLLIDFSGRFFLLSVVAFFWEQAPLTLRFLWKLNVGMGSRAHWDLTKVYVCACVRVCVHACVCVLVVGRPLRLRHLRAGKDVCPRDL